MKTTERHHLKDNPLAMAIGSAQGWFEKNQKALLAIVAILVVVAGGIAAYAAWARRVDTKARTLQKFLSRGYEVVASVDARLDRALTTYKDEMMVTFPIIDDSKFAIAGKFGIASTPALAIVDKDGKVEYWVAGYTAETKLKTLAAFDKYVNK